MPFLPLNQQHQSTEGNTRKFDNQKNQFFLFENQINFYNKMILAFLF